MTVFEMADRVEQFANRFVSKARLLTAFLDSAVRWAEIDPNHPDVVAARKEIVKIDPEFTTMLNDLVNLTKDCETDIQGEEANAAPGDSPDEQRIAAALSEMTAVLKEYTKQRERYAALPNWIEDTNTEFLIGSQRFFRTFYSTRSRSPYVYAIEVKRNGNGTTTKR
jgi:hypothetical protein